LLAALRKLLHALKTLFCFVEIAIIDEYPARLVKALDVVGIERERFFISLKRSLWVSQPRDGAEVAVGDCRLLAVLFGLRRGLLSLLGCLLGMGRLRLRDFFEEFRGLDDFVVLQKPKRSFKTAVARFRPLRDRRDRRPNRLLRARSRRRIFLQQHFDK